MNIEITIVFLLMITRFHQNFGFKTKITILQKNEIFVSEFDQQTIEDKDGDMPETNYKIGNKGWVCTYYIQGVNAGSVKTWFKRPTKNSINAKITIEVLC